jgi:hypothetical protein
MRATDASGPETRENLYITRAPAPTITPQLMSVFRHRLPMSVCLGLPSEITQPLRPFDCQFYAREVRSERAPRERKLLPGLGGDNALEVPTGLGGDKHVIFLSNGDSVCEITSPPPRPSENTVDVTEALGVAEPREQKQPESHDSARCCSVTPWAKAKEQQRLRLRGLGQCAEDKEVLSEEIGCVEAFVRKHRNHRTEVAESEVGQKAGNTSWAMSETNASGSSVPEKMHTLLRELAEIELDLKSTR